MHKSQKYIYIVRVTCILILTGQHECVSLINNFFAREDLDYYTVKQGLSGPNQ